MINSLHELIQRLSVVLKHEMKLNKENRIDLHFK